MRHLLRPISTFKPPQPPVLRKRLVPHHQRRLFTVQKHTTVLPDMEVPAGSWHLEKPDILKRIDEADFIAFDLELSGISMARDKGKHSVQQRYEEVKKAAEQYQVFQLGVCPVRYDAETETYILSPYNFYVNPIAAESRATTIERSFSISSSAADFLRGCDFDFNAVFKKGIPYISRAEEKALIEAEEAKVAQKFGTAKVDQQNEEFVKRVEAEIREWLAQEKPENDFLNIASSHPGATLNRYQKLLVHQVVGLHFEGQCTSIGRGDFVQVKRYDEEREKKDKEERMDRFQKSLRRSIGLRAVVDKILVPKDSQDKKKIIVGHNVFSDLIYLYDCFVGPLPATVDEFGKEILNSCKMVIDTKFMATHRTSNASSNSSLQSMWDTLSSLSGPELSVPPAHLSYMANSSHHEAGYDAFNTARVLLYMAPIIQNIRPYLVSKIHNGEVNLAQATLYMLEALYGTESFKKILADAKEEVRLIEEAEIKKEEERDEDQEIRDANKPILERPTGALEIEVEKETEKLLSQPKVSAAVIDNSNPYAVLSTEEPAVEDADDESPPEDYGWDDNEGEEDVSEPKKKPVLFPSLKNVDGKEFFWKEFGNRLRVFGTIENVAILGEIDERLSDEEEGGVSLKDTIEVKEEGEKVASVKVGEGSVVVEVGKEEKKDDGTASLLQALKE
ncbi:CAF1-domain-containing protein [Ascobolus immersus RN42]|uniref:CAF1-domain-containing protein n=1 Tax=Ascobolus immersus RN42 TaxID=1160509 RepID=A0A3N4I601_ASCIM|nr:CAF1-domain-containing protein [Ascobolus immersus RN42]